MRLIRPIELVLIVGCALVSTLTVGPGLAVCQTPVQVDEATAGSHLLKKVEPQYPPLAKMARLQGTVELKVRIGKDGLVAAVTVKSGHPLLVASAIQAVKQWKYTPFVSDGKAAEVMTTVKIPFSLGIPTDKYKNEQQISNKFFNSEEECRKLIKSQHYDQAEPSCEATVALAEQLPPERALERADAYADMGWDLAGRKEFKEALKYFQKEVNMDEKVRKRDDADLGYGYHDLALGLVLNGNPNAALDYYQRSIHTLELARKNMASSANGTWLAADYANHERKILLEYSTILSRLGEGAAAAAAERQANSIH